MAASVWIGGMYMGKENDLMLEYLRDNHRFADLFNGGLFFGKCVVEASQLEEASENYTEFRKAPANTAANTTNGLAWWWLLIVALLGATGYKMYKDHQKKKEEAQEA